MALTPEQIIAREGKLTASRVAALMDGDKEEIYRIWQELCGDPSFVPENLDDVWQVQLGSLTEKINLDWYEKKRDRILTRRGEVVVHPDYEWAAATLDGFDEMLPGPVETKHSGGYEKHDTVVQRYMAQCHWQMECTQTKQCALSIIYGNKEPFVEVIPYNKGYADEMMVRAHKFMVHVWEMTPPVELEPVRAHIPQSQMREYNFTGNNHFAAYANDWLRHKQASIDFDKAQEALKEMVPHDANRVFGHGISISRSKSGSIRIKPL